MISYSANALTISETLQNNAIVWIQSLPEDEMGPTRRILEDLKTLTVASGFQVHECVVRDRAELFGTLKQLSELARRDGLRPIVHVDAHGTMADGLLLAPSRERAGWAETIEGLRELNVATENNLVCIFALCFGLHIYKTVSLKKPVPAYLFFAPSSEISVGFLEAQTLAFYREINHTSNVTAAFQKTLGAGMESFHCQGLFLQSLLRYIRTYCTGRQRRSRLERMVTAVLKRDKITDPSSAQLKEIRRKTKEFLDPGQDLIDRFAPSFLIGRTAAFEYEDIQKILDQTSFGTGP